MENNYFDFGVKNRTPRRRVVINKVPPKSCFKDENRSNAIDSESFKPLTTEEIQSMTVKRERKDGIR